MASTSQDRYDPDHVSPPGETLKDLLEERNLTQAELATRMGRPQKTISEIVNGKAAITPETALQLELVLGVPARFWNSREQRYREYLARAEQQAVLAEQLEWARRFPLRELGKMGFIPKVREPAEQVRYTLGFLGVSSPAQWSDIFGQCEVAFRRSTAFDADEYALGAWLRVGVLQAQDIRLASFDKGAFLERLQTIRALTTLEPADFQPQVRSLCAEAGVAVVFVPQLPKSRVSGATRWLSSTSALIQLSLRYKTNDHLWSTFFHEAAHLLLHGKRAIFLDTGKSEGELEKQADAWASEFLIPRNAFEELSNDPPYSKAKIVAFAERIGIAPGIVVGRLQHERKVLFSHCNDLKVRLQWSTESAP
jgi:HTH-type transcriptional regulator / antitoxin HigA